MRKDCSSEPIELLSDPAAADGADLTFRRVLRRVSEAERSVEIHMYVWRSDEVGNAVGREVLSAAQRGVRVRIIKDVGAFMYERLEMNRKSLFNKPVSRLTRLQYRLLMPTFPDTYIADDYDDALGRQLMAHPNVTMQWMNHTHTKYYILDEQTMIIGSINLEDRHRGYRDYMAEIRDAELVARFRDRQLGRAPFDPGRTVDFVVNRADNTPPSFEIKPLVLDLLAAARKSVYIEMAYIGDPDISRRIVETANRGVAVHMLFSRKANIGNDINYKALYGIRRACPIRVFLTDKMIHSKLMMVDQETVLFGSANFSVFSLQKAAEVDLLVRGNPGFLKAVQVTVEQRLRESQEVADAAQLGGYNRALALGQQIHQKLNNLFG